MRPMAAAAAVRLSRLVARRHLTLQLTPKSAQLMRLVRVRTRKQTSARKIPAVLALRPAHYRPIGQPQERMKVLTAPAEARQNLPPTKRRVLLLWPPARPQLKMALQRKTQ